MNIIVVTTNSRPQILAQTMLSIVDNAVNLSQHRLVLVVDGDTDLIFRNQDWFIRSVGTLIINSGSQGASASRNIGASSIPKYRRQECVCFFDDDVYCTPGWDRQIEDALKHSKSTRPIAAVVSGHAHPYNHTVLDDRSHFGYRLTTVLSTVNIVCAWSIWDIVGWFTEPGGPGGSEDVDWCARATKKGYDLAVTNPQCVLHTRLASSSGKPIVGANEVAANNRQLAQLHHIEGSVRYGW